MNKDLMSQHDASMDGIDGTGDGDGSSSMSQPLCRRAGNELLWVYAMNYYGL